VSGLYWYAGTIGEKGEMGVYIGELQSRWTLGVEGNDCLDMLHSSSSILWL
jgi:hypothetical protein